MESILPFAFLTLHLVYSWKRQFESQWGEQTHVPWKEIRQETHTGRQAAHYVEFSPGQQTWISWVLLLGWALQRSKGVRHSDFLPQFSVGNGQPSLYWKRLSLDNWLEMQKDNWETSGWATGLGNSHANWARQAGPMGRVAGVRS